MTFRKNIVVFVKGIVHKRNFNQEYDLTIPFSIEADTAENFSKSINECIAYVEGYYGLHDGLKITWSME